MSAAVFEGFCGRDRDGARGRGGEGITESFASIASLVTVPPGAQKKCSAERVRALAPPCCRVADLCFFVGVLREATRFSPRELRKEALKRVGWADLEKIAQALYTQEVALLFR